ncbi:MAG: LmbE family N-acetylglucosaminyl deacetylase [Granulosicoccus sp.]|jgi:LmbE family N-acetylglucosaminyl deacetylase
MSLSDIQRIERQTTTPRALTLWRTLQSLKCCTSFMNTGAHPDDETSAMLAALSYRDGINISYACANRGEGGQNNMGSHSVYDLGVIRTAEMERAADVLSLRLYWLNEAADDTIFDFGFSKSGVETLDKWGHTRTLKRFVHIIRTERPDIICPTFLDIPGQHGHHRAMTQLAHEVIDAAVDESFDKGSLPPWQVKKLYLPAWSGAGDAYDDDLPPPPATLVINAKGEEDFSGWTYEQIGQQSRAFHKSQGMGRWVSPGEERDWPLHLARCTIDGADNSLCAGLPTSLASLSTYASAPDILDSLVDADTAIEHAIMAFPDLDKVCLLCCTALKLVRLARTQCPATAFGEIDHRLERKEAQLSIAVRLSSKATVSASFIHDTFRAGDTVPLDVEVNHGTAESLEWKMKLPTGWSHTNDQVHVAAQSSSESTYPVAYFPHEPAAPCLQLTVVVNGETSTTCLPLDTTPLLLPTLTARATPSSVVVNAGADSAQFIVDINEKYPDKANTSLKLPEGWSSESERTGFRITVPKNTQAGIYELEVLLDLQPASTVNLFDFPHIEQRMRIHKSGVHVCVLNVDIPQVRVGYVGGGNDQVAEKLTAMGFDVQHLSDRQLVDTEVFKQLDTLVIGLFAIRTRPVLQTIISNIHQWVHDGGNMLTLYHRPWDDWNENTIPPKRLKIGKPSLRWRVTDETASVTHMLPDHLLLNTPNVINQNDWQGWHKERGLYFAAEWDEAYDALLSMSDPEESAHTGALLSAQIGAGRHTHTSLLLHHQMEQLVPGAFRLMANLVGGGR